MSVPPDNPPGGYPPYPPGDQPGYQPYPPSYQPYPPGYQPYPPGFQQYPPGYQPGYPPADPYRYGYPSVLSTGYAGYGSMQFSGTKGLRTWTIILFWAGVAMSWLIAIAMLVRKTTVDDVLSGSATVDDLHGKDDFVDVSSLFYFLALIAGVIVLCIWSQRVVRNAQARGAVNVSPGLACGGWYIPIGNIWVPFTQIRRAVTQMGRSVRSLLGWQIAYPIASGVLGVGLTVVPQDSDDHTKLTADHLSALVNTSVVLGFVGAAGLSLAAYFATRALLQIDETISGGH